MKFAVIGGTHGNEPIGIEVVKYIEELEPREFKNEFKIFIGNPKAFALQKRFIDYDLNRCFDTSKESKGYERERAAQLKSKIEGNFDFLLDLHTTTSNMGLTLILTATDPFSRQAAAYLKSYIPEIRIIETQYVNQDCSYINRLAPSSLTIEVGPVANNVVHSKLVMATYQMTQLLLNWNPNDLIDLSSIEYFKSIEDIHYPKEGKWFIHPEREASDFKEVKKRDPLFINWEGEIKPYQGDDSSFPIFINEAAYQNGHLAMTLTKKKSGFI